MRRNMMVLGLLAVVLVFVSTIGCDRGPKTIKVTGNVTVNGEPVEGVVVEFYPQPTGRPGIGFADENGDFEIQFTKSKKGTLPGKNLVNISAYRNPEDERSQYLPAEYNSKAADNPDMMVEVTSSNHTFDFNVEMDSAELEKQRAKAEQERAEMEAEGH